MSAQTCGRKLARKLALRMADGTLSRLPRFRSTANPSRVRAHLMAYYVLRDEMAEMRREQNEVMSVRERVQAAVAAEKIESAINDAKRLLSRFARRGIPVQRGVSR